MSSSGDTTTRARQIAAEGQGVRAGTRDLNGALPEGAASSGCYVGTWEALDTSRDGGVISSRLKGGYGWKEVLCGAPMYDLFSKSGVSDPAG